jgi:GT2 family glycosyltransferase
VIPVPASFSRAAAKNLAVAEARGEILLLATADTVARPGAVALLQDFIFQRRAPAVASAQLLSENGTRRRTSFPIPSIAREINPFGWLCRPRRSSRRSSGPPAGGPCVQAAALHATFLMARRETFRSVGDFAEGYRFAFEDVEWCWRARKKGIGLYVCPDARVFKLPPQLRGELPPEIRAGIESSRLRCVRAARGPAYARTFRAVRRSKSLAAWLAAASLNRLLCRSSDLLANRAAVHHALWRLPPDAAPSPDCAPDIESHVAWEMMV